MQSLRAEDLEGSDDLLMVLLSTDIWRLRHLGLRLNTTQLLHQIILLNIPEDGSAITVLYGRWPRHNVSRRLLLERAVVHKRRRRQLTNHMHRVVQQEVLATLAEDNLLHWLAELEPLLLHLKVLIFTLFKGCFERPERLTVSQTSIFFHVLFEYKKGIFNARTNPATGPIKKALAAELY